MASVLLYMIANKEKSILLKSWVGALVALAGRPGSQDCATNVLFCLRNDAGAVSADFGSVQKAIRLERQVVHHV